LNWTKNLLNWYKENKRTFLWRTTKDPYKIWLSEIILQQTRTAQGSPYYEKFITAFPTVKELANAREEEVLKLWQGLGYYSRARNLHTTAKFIYKELKGVFPTSFEGLLSLKGVGDYTASAITSICYNQPQAVVDGNVYRFLSRFFGIDTPINSSEAHRIFKRKAQMLMDRTQPGTFNQAMMEFGALQCTPKQPLCSSCPFATKCIAFNQDKVTILPVKKGKVKVADRFFNYIILKDPKGKVLMEQRLGKGIWQNLYQFPLVETSEVVWNSYALINQIEASNTLTDYLKDVKLWNETPVIHKLSHQRLHIHFWIGECPKPLKKGLSIKEIKERPVPIVLQNFIENFFKINL